MDFQFVGECFLNFFFLFFFISNPIELRKYRKNLKQVVVIVVDVIFLAANERKIIVRLKLISHTAEIFLKFFHIEYLKILIFQG